MLLGVSNSILVCRIFVEKEEGKMSRVCELTGKRVMVGNNVSHANNKVRRRFLPNLVRVTLISDILKKRVQMLVCAAAIRTVEHCGGLDMFLQKVSGEKLSGRARVLKKQISDKKKIETQ